MRRDRREAGRGGEVREGGRDLISGGKAGRPSAWRRWVPSAAGSFAHTLTMCWSAAPLPLGNSANGPGVCAGWRMVGGS